MTVLAATEGELAARDRPTGGLQSWDRDPDLWSSTSQITGLPEVTSLFCQGSRFWGFFSLHFFFFLIAVLGSQQNQEGTEISCVAVPRPVRRLLVFTPLPGGPFITVDGPALRRHPNPPKPVACLRWGGSLLLLYVLGRLCNGCVSTTIVSHKTILTALKKFTPSSPLLPATPGNH